MLLAVHPLAIINSSILPFEDALTLSLIVDEVTLILLAISPFKHAAPVHFILVPVSVVGFAVRPDVLATARNLVLEESSRVNAAVGERQCAFSILFSDLVATIIPRAVRPRFNTLSMLLIIEPIANIRSSICMTIGSAAMCLVVEPITFVYVSICMDQSTKAVGLIAFPHAFVRGRVRPDLHTAPMFASIDSLTCVLRAISVGSRRHVNFVVWRELTLQALLVAVLNFKLLFVLVDVGNIILMTLIFALLGLNSDFLFPLEAFRAAMARAISHLIFLILIS